MNLPAPQPSRTLVAVIGIGVCNHVVLNGVRVASALAALNLGATLAVVGAVIAVFAFMPMLFAVHAGRLIDRVGVRRPMLAGSVGVALGAALPGTWPGLPALFAAAGIVGGAFMVCQVATQRLAGDLGGPADRSANYALLALGYSTSGFVGPLLAGFAIDHLGFDRTFLLFALVPVVSCSLLASGRLALPRVTPSADSASGRRVFDLLALPAVQRLLAVNALFALAWDLHTVFIPIYGAKIGLRAGDIGMILSAFAAATFVVRFGMRWLVRSANEQKVLALALAVAGAAYLTFPFSKSATTLMMLSFALGLGLGAGQPLVMSLLHSHVPTGRMGEAAGIRMALIQALAVAVPLVFGALGGSLGLLPVFWCVGLSLAGGALYARRQR